MARDHGGEPERALRQHGGEGESARALSRRAMHKVFRSLLSQAVARDFSAFRSPSSLKEAVSFCASLAARRRHRAAATTSRPPLAYVVADHGALDADLALDAEPVGVAADPRSELWAELEALRVS